MTAEPLRIGITGRSRTPAERICSESRGAEVDGAECVLWPDHLMAWHATSLWNDRFTPLAAVQSDPHEYLSPVVAMAATATATDRVRIGSGVTDVLRQHPATVAQQYLSLHHLSGGRCILGLGAGEGENLLPYGIAHHQPVGRLEDGLRVIRALWEAEGPVSFDSEYWPHDRAVLGLGPFADGSYPAIWVAGHGPRMLELTAHWADGWIPMLMSPLDYANSLARIENSRLAAGRRGPFEAAIWSFVCYGESKDDCRRLFESPMYRTLALLLPAAAFEAAGVPHPLGQRAYGLTSFVPTWLSDEEMLEAALGVPPELVEKMVLHGSVADIEIELDALHAAGCQTACLGNISFLTDMERVRDSFQRQRELLGRYAATGGPDRGGSAQERVRAS